MKWQMMVWMLGLSVIASLGAGCDSGPSDEQIQGWRSEVATALSIADDYDAAWRAALDEAVRSRRSLEMAGECSLDFTMYDDGLPGKVRRMRGSVAPVNAVEEGLPRVAAVREQLSELSDILTDSPAIAGNFVTADVVQLLEDVSHPEWWGRDPFLLIEDYLAPRQDGLFFSSGRIGGWMFVWDYDSQEIVCASELEVGNSDSIEQGMGEFDLVHNAFRIGLENVRAIERQP